MPSNQGRDIDQLLGDVDFYDLKAATSALWTEVRGHDAEASCECPTIETLAMLYERGYRVVRS